MSLALGLIIAWLALMLLAASIWFTGKPVFGGSQEPLAWRRRQAVILAIGVTITLPLVYLLYR